MPEFTRTQAFAALADIFQLPGSETLRLLDISIATPVIDLSQVIRSGVGEVWLFGKNASAATAVNFTLDPFATGWNSVYKAGSALGVNGVLPENYEALILDVGVEISATGLNDAWIGLAQADSAVPSTSELQTTWWLADQEIAIGSNPIMLDRAGSSQLITTPPWYLPSPKYQRARPRYRASYSVSIATSIALRLIAAPRGVLPVV